MRDEAPRGVHQKGGRWYLVVAEGTKRKWHSLTKVSQGLPALYTALGQKKLELAQATDSFITMPALIAHWERDVMPAHAAKTQRDDRAYGRVIAAAFAAFTPAQVETPDCSDFLQQFKSKPRTFNAYRSQLREYMRFAEERGMRPAGSNPLQSIRTLRVAPRGRYITDSELRRIKVAALKAQDRHGGDLDTRSGPMLCALIDMAYLTGQAIGDLLALEWDQIGVEGIAFARSKVEQTTGSKVVIGWTPKLRDVVSRLKNLREERGALGTMVFVRQDGLELTYWGAASAWKRARDRAGVTGCTFHDLKAKALTDKEAKEGMRAAQAMGQHATESQTVTYVRRRSGRKIGATR